MAIFSKRLVVAAGFALLAGFCRAANFSGNQGAPALWKEQAIQTIMEYFDHETNKLKRKRQIITVTIQI